MAKPNAARHCAIRMKSMMLIFLSTLDNHDMITLPCENYGKQPEPLPSKPSRMEGVWGGVQAVIVSLHSSSYGFIKKPTSEKAHAYCHRYDHVNR